jgi:hypothetical protein
VAEDVEEQADRALIEQFIAEDPEWQRWPGDEGTILDIGDLETHWVLAERDGRFTFETISRGHRRVTADFAVARDARCFLLMRLGASWRFRRRLPDIICREVAPDTTVENEQAPYRLVWSKGAASFVSRYDAVEFSWVAGAEPAAIAASYRNLDGKPLFDLSLAEVADPVRRPRLDTLRPRPIETPPPDPDIGSDLPVIDQLAAEIEWTREDAAPPDLLLVGDGAAGRVISYERSQFEFKHFVRDWRKTIATFSTAAAARRFLVMEMGAIRRTRRGLPVIRVHAPHPETTLRKAPTQFELSWPGGHATFGLGYNGHQLALTFSCCAQASLADIVASYDDRAGSPLFDSPDASTRPDWHS